MDDVVDGGAGFSLFGGNVVGSVAVFELSAVSTGSGGSWTLAIGACSLAA